MYIMSLNHLKSAKFSLMFNRLLSGHNGKCVDARFVGAARRHFLDYNGTITKICCTAVCNKC